MQSEQEQLLTAPVEHESIDLSATIRTSVYQTIDYQQRTSLTGCSGVAVTGASRPIRLECAEREWSAHQDTLRGWIQGRQLKIRHCHRKLGCWQRSHMRLGWQGAGNCGTAAASACPGAGDGDSVAPTNGDRF